PKPIIKISSQIGCPAHCKFCDLGDAPFRRNLLPHELLQQFQYMYELSSELGIRIGNKQHKVNVAGSGEPLLNKHLVDGLKLIAEYEPSFKVCTVAPKSKATIENFKRLAEFGGSYAHPIQIQISLISTSQLHREQSVGMPLLVLDQISALGKLWRAANPVRSQINLSLILAADTPVDVAEIVKLLPPEHYRFRFRPYIPTNHGRQNALRQISNDQMEEVKAAFRAEGYYVGEEATPTATEQTFELASNVSRKRVDQGQ
ncbi:MAG: radical SAM protein, partial [Bdellovibrionales bacterium]|nr:radical SAM protein [Bdellovibrionales bacterium]